MKAEMKCATSILALALITMPYIGVIEGSALPIPSNIVLWSDSFENGITQWAKSSTYGSIAQNTTVSFDGGSSLGLMTSTAAKSKVEATRSVQWLNGVIFYGSDFYWLVPSSLEFGFLLLGMEIRVATTPPQAYRGWILISAGGQVDYKSSDGTFQNAFDLGSLATCAQCWHHFHLTIDFVNRFYRTLVIDDKSVDLNTPMYSDTTGGQAFHAIQWFYELDKNSRNTTNVFANIDDAFGTNESLSEGTPQFAPFSTPYLAIAIVLSAFLGGTVISETLEFARSEGEKRKIILKKIKLIQDVANLAAE